MKRIGLLVLLFICSISYGQLAKVVDKDGYVNVRKEGNVNSSVVGKFKSGDIVQVLDTGLDVINWYEVNGGDSNNIAGFVYKDRLKMLSEYTELANIETTQNQLVFSGYGYQISISIAPFDYEKNKSKFTKQKVGGLYIEKYNDQLVVGTDGMKPSVHYRSINVRYKDKDINYPLKAYENMFHPNGREHTKCFYDTISDTLYLVANNGDGSFGYTVIWMFKEGKYLYNNFYDHS